MNYEERMATMGFKTIDSAPRNGTMIVVTAEGEPLYEMCWNQFGTNWLVQPSKRGIWWGKDGNFTWSEQGGFGPTHWAPLDHALVKGLKGERMEAGR